MTEFTRPKGPLVLPDYLPVGVFGEMIRIVLRWLDSDDEDEAMLIIRLMERFHAGEGTPLVAAQMTHEQRDRIVRWLRECQALLAEPTEVPELEALIAVVAAQTSPPTADDPIFAELARLAVTLANVKDRQVMLDAIMKFMPAASPPTPEPEKQP